jgi:alpha-N-acetylglucosaminidase
MRVSNLVAWIFATGVVAIRTTASTAGVESLVQRRLPQHAASFQFEVVDAINVTQTETEAEIERINDSYIVSSTNDGKILVQGNTVGALFAG